MSSKSSYVSKYVVCPFYRRHNGNRICCEGVTETCTNNIVFEDPKELKDYCSTYCEDIHNYENCRICATLNGKYEKKKK